jgi:hypothetical protein
MLGVLDSGSPVSVANADLFRWLGIDIDQAEPVYEMPLSVGGGSSRHPYSMSNYSSGRQPTGRSSRFPWRLQLGARRRWRLPFAVLLGQPGWFERFPTRIDRSTSTIEI